MDLILHTWYPAFAHAICLRNLRHSVKTCIKYRLGWIMAYIMCLIVERLSLFHTAYSQVVAQHRSMPKSTIIVSQLVAFLSNVFSVFFHWMRPCNVHCWRSSCLDLVTAHAIIPQLTSDPILNTHQISSWSPPTLLYHNWYQVSAPTLLYHNWYQVSDPVSHTHQMPRVA